MVSWQSVAVIVTIVIGFVTGALYIDNTIDTMATEVDKTLHGIKLDIAIIKERSGERWTVYDMERWANGLRISDEGILEKPPVVSSFSH